MIHTQGDDHMKLIRNLIPLAAFFALTAVTMAEDKVAKDNTPPEGFTALFNGKDLSNWQGLIEYPQREKLGDKLPEAQKKADKIAQDHWSVSEGVLVYDGKGQSLQTSKDYGDFEFFVDWKIGKKGDSGIYLRGAPQVQIWDDPVGSGGFYNNQKNPSKPLKVADKPVGEWNTFRIIMKGDKATIYLNGVLVVDNTVLEPYWGRNNAGKPVPPLPAKGPIELQHHGNPLYFKNIYIKELN